MIDSRDTVVVPAGHLLRPLPLVALVVLVVNDHLLKAAWPSVVTGKLSDVAGVVLLPLLLVAAVELARAATGRPWEVGTAVVWACVTAVAVGFAAVKLWPEVARAYGAVLGVARWPVLGTWRRVGITHDLTDLATLPAAGLAALDIGLARKRGE